MQRVFQVDVKPSKMEGAGLGLVTTTDQTNIRWLCPMGTVTESLNEHMLASRYGGDRCSAPYALKHDEQLYDFAVYSGPGSYANSSREDANAIITRIDSEVFDYFIANDIADDAKVFVRDAMYMWLRATKSIRSQQEVFVDYGAIYALHMGNMRRYVDNDATKCPTIVQGPECCENAFVAADQAAATSAETSHTHTRKSTRGMPHAYAWEYSGSRCVKNRRLLGQGSITPPS